MRDECPICQRPCEPSSDYCSLHAVALENLERAYPAWSKAYDGRLSKKEVFEKIRSLPETGRRVKEVIEHLFTKCAVT